MIFAALLPLAVSPAVSSEPPSPAICEVQATSDSDYHRIKFDAAKKRICEACKILFPREFEKIEKCAALRVCLLDAWGDVAAEAACHEKHPQP